MSEKIGKQSQERRKITIELLKLVRAQDALIEQMKVRLPTNEAELISRVQAFNKERIKKAREMVEINESEIKNEAE